MSSRFGVPMNDLRIRTDPGAAAIASSAGARAYATRDEIGFAPGAYEPHTSAGQRRIAHEFAHAAQFRGGNSRAGSLPSNERKAAEWQAHHAVSTTLAGGRPALSGYAGSGPLYDRDPVQTRVQAEDDRVAFETIRNALDTTPAGHVRSAVVHSLVDLALKQGAMQDDALKLLTGILTGLPAKVREDHESAIAGLLQWVGKDPSAYSLILIGRSWFADQSLGELPNHAVRDAFANWLHYQGGRFAINFLRIQINGKNQILANLAARVVADLLEQEKDPKEAKYKANYKALRDMARSNGWESYGVLGTASATPVIFSALDGLREEARGLIGILQKGPKGDFFEQLNILMLQAVLSGTIDKLSQPGELKTASGRILFTAENREESEHGLATLNSPARDVAKWTQEMAAAVSTALTAGARVQARVLAIQDNVRSLDTFLGADAAAKSDEELSLFQLRHDYIEAWLSIFGKSFDSSSQNVAQAYQQRLDEVELRFQNFDQEVAKRKFVSAREHFQSYSKMWNAADQKSLGSGKLVNDFLTSAKRVLRREQQALGMRFVTTGGSSSGGVMVTIDQPKEGVLPTNLAEVSQLSQDASIFGMQAAMLMVYTTNLSVHAMMDDAEVGNKDFRADHGKRLTDQRTEMEGFWNSGALDVFLTKSDGYISAIKEVASDIKDRAELDALIQIGITILAALVTEGAALAVRLGTISRIASVVRTAEAIQSIQVLVDVGVFTATDLTLQHAAFGRDIGVSDVIKEIGTNLLFMGALKIVGKFAAPLIRGSKLQQLVIGHIVGFTGVAGVSAIMTRIESGKWPPDMGTFLMQTGATYLLLAGVHHAFERFVGTPVLKDMVSGRLEGLNADNEALLAKLSIRTAAGTMTEAEFNDLRDERTRLVEEGRRLGRVLADNHAMTEAEFSAIDQMADNALADVKNAAFTKPAAGVDPTIHALPAPDSVIELTRVGDTDEYAYDPAAPHAPIDEMLSRYEEKGFKVEGNSLLQRIVDPEGRTRFTLTSTPPRSTRLLLPPRSFDKPEGTLLERATGQQGPNLTALRTELGKISRDIETRLSDEYPEPTAVSALGFIVEMRSRIGTGWSANAVRGVADAVSLDKGISREALRRLFLAVDPKVLPGVLAKFHEVSNSANVKVGTEFLIGEGLYPRNSVILIDAWRSMMAKGIELPADMDERAARGVLRLIDKTPGGWLEKVASLAKDKRASFLRGESGLVDPTVTVTEEVSKLLHSMSADIAGSPGLNPLSGLNGEEFVSKLEALSPSARFDDARLRTTFVLKVDDLRQRAAALQQGVPLGEGQKGPLAGLTLEIQRTAALYLEGAHILAIDRSLGPRAQLPNIDPAAFALRGGSKVINAPPEKDVHTDLLYKDAKGVLTAVEMTTARLGLPEAAKGLDPKNPSYGKDVDWSLLNPDRNPSDRKIMQAIKIYQLREFATKLGVAWSGEAADPTAIKFDAGDFTAELARALENMGFQLEISGKPTTAAEIEARKGPKVNP